MDDRSEKSSNRTALVRTKFDETDPRRQEIDVVCFASDMTRIVENTFVLMDNTDLVGLR